MLTSDYQLLGCITSIITFTGFETETMNDGSARNGNYYDIDDILIEEEVNYFVFTLLIIFPLILKLPNSNLNW